MSVNQNFEIPYQQVNTVFVLMTARVVKKSVEDLERIHISSWMEIFTISDNVCYEKFAENGSVSGSCFMNFLLAERLLFSAWSS